MQGADVLAKRVLAAASVIPAIGYTGAGCPYRVIIEQPEIPGQGSGIGKLHQQ